MSEQASPHFRSAVNYAQEGWGERYVLSCLDAPVFFALSSVIPSSISSALTIGPASMLLLGRYLQNQNSSEQHAGEAGTEEDVVDKSPKSP